MKHDSDQWQAALTLADRAKDANELRFLLDLLGLNDIGPERVRALRTPDFLWNGLGKAAKSMSSDRAKVIKQFIRWYLGYPGAELPERPCDRQEAAA